MCTYLDTGHEVFNKLLKLSLFHAVCELLNVKVELAPSQPLLLGPQRAENLFSYNGEREESAGERGRERERQGEGGCYERDV